MQPNENRRFRPYHPGDIAPASGQYEEVGPRNTGKREVTVAKGEPFPPTTKKGASYRLVDVTENESVDRRSGDRREPGDGRESSDRREPDDGRNERSAMQ